MNLQDSFVSTSHIPAGTLGLEKQTCVQLYILKQEQQNLLLFNMCGVVEIIA